jgi:hypothetical protein
LQPKQSGYEGFWLGANDIQTEGKFVWGATGKPITYSNWDWGQPDNKNGVEDCVQILTSSEREGKWNDLPCETSPIKQFTMCERVLG